MILMYHKIHPTSPNIWWVSVDDFYRQMAEISHKKIVYLDDYDPQNPDHVVITFDGVYQNVVKFALPILRKFNYPFELFISGDQIGQNNDFDSGENVRAQFADTKELKKLIKAGGRLEWHSKTHSKLTEIKNAKKLLLEFLIPQKIKKLDPKNFKYFAYPHGEFNKLCIKIAKKKFKGALSVIQGNDVDKFKLNRLTVINDSSFAKAQIGVIIPCYNYGSFLVEAVESVLKQTRPAHKILIIDDASTDNTQQIAQSYAQKYPDLISYYRNPKNLGIIKNFNKAVKLIKTDYICFLGADNRFRSDYLEKTSLILDKDPKIAIAYTDFALFGPLASNMYSLMPLDRRAGVLENYFYLVKFPEFNQQSVKNLKEINFMHGSSMYKKIAFDKVGGYLPKKGSMAEDHSLFYRIIKAGWKAKRIPQPLLEYRQHSRDQVNTKLNSFAELNFYKQEYLKVKIELDKIKSSKFWKLLFLIKQPKVASKIYLAKLINKFR